MIGTQSSIQIADGLATLQTLGVVIETPVGGAPFAAPLSAPAGSGGKDWSVNAPVAPLIGATLFGGPSTYSAWFLLQTIPANMGAAERRIRNNSTSAILLAFDDGAAVAGSTPTNSHIELIQPASAQAPNDISIITERFKGRIRIFCSITTAWVAVLES